MGLRRSIVLATPGQWELEIAGEEQFVLDMGERLGLFTHATPVGLGGPGSAMRPAHDMLPQMPLENSPPPSERDAEFEEPSDAAGDEAAGDEVDGEAVDGEGVIVDVFYRRFMRGRDAATLSTDELVLLFGYYMEEHMEKATWSALDLSMCFTLAGLEQPRNTIGVLSTMARQKGTILQDTPGDYCLSDKSRAMIKAVMSA